MVIVTRRFNPDSDTGIVRDTMPKSIYYDTHPRKGRPSKTWFEQFDIYLRETLQTAQTVMAVADDNPDFIMGYAIFHDSKCIFIYVKDTYRKQGIATMLSKEVTFQTFNEATMTKLGKQILEQQRQFKENLLAKPSAAKIKDPDQSLHEKPALTAETAQALSKDIVGALISNGFELQKISFQSAILAGFNSAEFQLARHSTNKMRAVDSIHWTQAGIIWQQNGKVGIVPFSNVIQGDIV